jgi:predicted sulfurtransferase
MRAFILFTLSVCAALVFLACNSTETTPVSRSPVASSSPIQSLPHPAEPNDGVRRVTTTELRDMLAKHEAVVIDVRTEPAYQLSHIQGAKLIPFPEIANRIGELPHDKLVVTYCS